MKTYYAATAATLQELITAELAALAALPAQENITSLNLTSIGPNAILGASDAAVPTLPAVWAQQIVLVAEAPTATTSQDVLTATLNAATTDPAFVAINSVNVIGLDDGRVIVAVLYTQ